MNKTVTDNNIWSNYVRTHVQPGRKNWKCTFCKCNPETVPAECMQDTKHRFKKAKNKRSKTNPCPNFVLGAEFQQRVIWDVRQSAKHHTYHVPAITANCEYVVHRTVFQQVFNIGDVRLRTCQRNRFVAAGDGRAGSSGRKPHLHLRAMIDSFWKNDVDKQPSHYDANSTSLICTGVSSATHGYLMFMSKYFPEKYLECVEKQYFPGISNRPPPSLSSEDLPKLSCPACIARSEHNNLTQTVCAHVPKYEFFKDVTSGWSPRKLPRA